MTARDKPVTSLSVLLVDLSAIFRACWHASANEPTSAAFEGTLTGVRRAMATLPGAHVAICCDGKGNWRKALSPEYKAQREKQPESMYGELDRVKARLRKDGHLVWECDKFEADDLIASAVQQAFAVPECHVRIATSDKDLLQLLAYDYVSCLSTRTWELVDLAAVTKKFGVAPSQIGDWLALVGDASDNVKGAPGVGPVKATALLAEFNTLAGIRHALDTRYASTSTPAIRKSLVENWEQVKLARQLVELRTDAPIVFREVFEKREVQSLSTEALESMDETIIDADGYADVPISAGPGPQGVAATSAQVTPNAPPTPPPPGVLGVQEAAGLVSAKEPERALVRVPVTYERALEPTSLDSAYKLAGYLYDSRMYPKLANREAIFAVMLRGRELALGALTSLDVIEMVEGRPALKSHLIIALCQAQPDCELFELVESTYEKATYRAKRRGAKEATTFTYTIQDAVNAGLCSLEMIPRTAKPGEKDGRGQWDKRRRELLRKTCGVQLGRIVWPGAALGLYSVAEMGGDEE